VGVDIIAVPDEPQSQQTKRTQRAEPITKRTAKNGSITYEFRADVGSKPNGTRDRRRFTYRTLSEARREYRRITSEVATGIYTRKSAVTVAEACDEWLTGRRGIRRVTLQGYTHDLKPVRRYLGGKKLQQLTKADGDELVEWMLTEGRTSPKRYRPDSLAARVVELIERHPEGIAAATIAASFPEDDVHTCLSGLLRASRVTRLRRAVYALNELAEAEFPHVSRTGGETVWKTTCSTSCHSCWPCLARLTCWVSAVPQRIASSHRASSPYVGSVAASTS
jgi:hypothetical protein